MTRAYCLQCERPEKSCLCHLVTSVDNGIHVVILQHPLEVKQSKGSVTLLHQSLKNSEVIVGEDFNDNVKIQSLLKRYNQQCAILYPSDNAVVLSEEKCNISPPKCLFILDGTWKKTYKMFMTNDWLQQLPHFTLADGIVGQYKIRKTTKKNALSSLEACCYALSVLERQQSGNNKYQALLDSFVKFNDFQLSFNPS
ncbi:MAG: DTW domain-containing protein [Colwellia sp.]|nr:DTW domain-containing protein [Colwellia sp.]